MRVLPSRKTKERFRASSSIALNLSEGSAKGQTQDRKRYFTIALGSIRECQAILDLEEQAFTLADRELLDKLAASKYRLIRNSSVRPR